MQTNFGEGIRDTSGRHSGSRCRIYPQIDSQFHATTLRHRPSTYWKSTYASDWFSYSYTPAHEESARYSTYWRSEYLWLVYLSSGDYTSTTNSTNSGDRTEGFSTTSEYFHHTIHQDQQQFRDQPNSVLEEEEGESNLASLKILEFMIPEIVKKDYDQGPSNMIVRSHDDLTIVGVVDLEWVYAGPAQLFASAPWWLLFDRPTDDNWDVVNGEPPKVATRYFKHLENFKRILDEEEGKIPESQKEFSNLVTWSEESGAMWLHMLVSNGFFGSSTFPCFQLQQNVGVEEWEEQIDEILDQEESIELLAKKPGERELYYKELEKVGECKHWLECEALTKEAFIVSVRKLLAEGPSEEIEEPSLLDRWVRPWF